MFQEVKEFHKAFDILIQDKPNLPTFDIRDLRVRLLREEFEEYLEGEETSDIVEIADALADIIYIACGTALSYGIDLDAVFKEVHDSNMAKLDENGKALRRADGKIIKPPAWKEPNIKKILDEQSIKTKQCRHYFGIDNNCLHCDKSLLDICDGN